MAVAKSIPDNLKDEIIDACISGAYTQKEIAIKYKMSPMTVSRIIEEVREKQIILKEFVGMSNAKTETKKALIEAMSDYAIECGWKDEFLIHKLFGCGITKYDFQRCGYGAFIKDYIKDIEEDSTE